MPDRLQYLFQKYLLNSCTRAELEEFLALANTDEARDKLKILIRECYEDIRKSDPSGTLVNEKGQLIFEVSEQPQPVATVRRLWSKRSLTIAAMFLLIVTLGTWRMISIDPRPAPVSELKTAASELRLVVLPDSTRVWLNASSTITFPEHFGDRSRVVYLSGEAFFDVQHAEKIPFIIHTGGVSTTVLGTAFNVRAYPRQKNVVVSVSRGKVKLSRGDQTVVTLVKGQQARVEQEGDGIVAKSVGTAEIGSWQRGDLFYDDEQFSEIIHDLERVYNVKIVIANQALTALPVTTTFRKNVGVEGALHVLCKLTDADLQKTTNGYLIK